jgi:hypothetical protein
MSSFKITIALKRLKLKTSISYRLFRAPPKVYQVCRIGLFNSRKKCKKEGGETWGNMKEKDKGKLKFKG